MAGLMLRNGLRSFPRLTDGGSRCLAALLPQNVRSPLAPSGSHVPSGSSNFHTCSILERHPNSRMLPTEPKKFPLYNDIVYPPRDSSQPRRPAEIFHFRANIKYSPKKMWYIAFMIRGMSVDEAIKQLSFVKRKGAEHVKEVLLEAQELAVKAHNVEYKSNLWVAESYALKSKIIKGLRKHARSRYGEVHYKYIHYFVVLREGPPPKHYYAPAPTGNEKISQYIEDLRNRRIVMGL